MSHAALPRLLVLAVLGLGSPLAMTGELLFAPTLLDAGNTPLALSAALPATTVSAPSPQVLPVPEAQRLRELELDLGAYAPELTERYLASARAQQAAGQHSAALETLDKALHSERLQQGLYTPTQFEIMALQVESLLAQHDYLDAFAQQQQLLSLQRRHYGSDSLETVDTQTRLANLYFNAFRQALSDPAAARKLFPAYGELSLYHQPEQLTTRHQLAYLWLYHAQTGLLNAIKVLLQAEAYDDPRLPALEQQLIQTYLLQAYERRIESHPDNFLYAVDVRERDSLNLQENNVQPCYLAGIKAHQRLIAYQELQAAPDPVAVANAMLALGDWHLLFGRNRAAQQQYQQAHAQLTANAETAALAPALLQPALPYQLPAFAALTDDSADVEFSGYVDIAFSIGKNGRVRDIEVLDASTNADARIQRQLRRQLLRAPFRPALDEHGKLLGERRVSLRYHFAQI